MESSQNNQHGNVPPPTAESGNLPNGAEGFRTVPNGSAAFGTIPKPSEPFRIVPHDTESFRTVPHPSERKESHTLTVREAARMFEAAGVARTERSIVNWCQPNRTGIARLDSYFDPNERKYFISPQSVELAIAEEQAKAAKNNEPAEMLGKVPPVVEAFRIVPNHAESERKPEPVSEADAARIKKLEQENLDLKIVNKGKDMMIEHLKKERAGFFEQLLAANSKVVRLYARLFQLGDTQADAEGDKMVHFDTTFLVGESNGSSPAEREGKSSPN
jgi:hypothetical protein